MGSGNSVVRHDQGVIDCLKNVWKDCALSQYEEMGNDYLEHSNQFKTVRVFVSSTFKDFFAEREILVKTVFPRLREWCEKRQLLLVEVDLRWGVPKESSSEQILRTCLGEIDRCRSENKSPYFINMLGHRYGWVPSPDDVPIDVHKEYQWIDGASVTHMEIAHAALRQSSSKALFMIRDDAYLYGLSEECVPDFIETDWVNKSSLDLLKHKLREQYGPSGRVIDYSPVPCGVDTSSGLPKVQFKGLEHFAKSIFDFLQREISMQYPLVSADDVTSGSCLDDAEKLKRRLGAAQENFMCITGKDIVGRDMEIGHVLNHLMAPFIMPDEFSGEYTGPLGCAPLLVYSDFNMRVGLSTVLAGAALAESKHELLSRVVFFHSLQCDMGLDAAESPGAVLTRLCLSLGNQRIRDKVTHEFSPESHGKWEDVTLLKIFREMLQKEEFNENITPDQPAWIFLDAIDLIRSDTRPNYYLVDIFPSPLPKQIRVVLASHNEGVRGHFFESIPHELVSANALYVPPLASELVLVIIQHKFADFNKILDATQLAYLLENPGSKNMTWLSLACEELRVFGVFETLTGFISSLPQTVGGLLELYLGRVKSALATVEGGKIMAFFENSLKLLVASKSGIMEAELMEILRTSIYLMPENTFDVASDNEGTLQSLTYEDWAHVHILLKLFIKKVIPQYVDIDHPLKPRYVLRNHAVQELLESYFGRDHEKLEDALMPHHRLLADFFSRSNDKDRQIEEYPHQLRCCKDYGKIREFIRTESFCRVRFTTKLNLLNFARCPLRFVVIPNISGPREEIMCLHCSMKCTFSPARLNRSACYTCGGQVFSQVMTFGGKISHRLNASEAVARMCSQHNQRSYQKMLMMNCVVCKLPATATSQKVPVFLCWMCALDKTRCCCLKS